MKQSYKVLGMTMGLAMGASSFAAAGVTVGGFVDAQYNWRKYDKKDTDHTKTQNTFTVPDGAVYLNGKAGETEVMVDMPFHADSSSADFTHFEEKGQAWIGATYENGFNWKLGQFDTFVGAEGNDSVDIHFNHHGLIFKKLPNVHRGLAVGYDFSDMMGLTLMVANPYTESGDMEEGNPDMGVHLEADLDTVKVSLGGLFGKDVGLDETKYLADVQVGLEVSHFNIALEFVMKKDTAAEFAADAARLMGGLELGYHVNDSWHATAGVEYAKLKDEKEMEVRVGPQFKAHENLTGKLDYTWTREDHHGALADHALRIGAVHSF